MDNIKIAKTDFPIIESIKNRWSTRSFSEKPIEKAIVNSLLEAARWTPSAYNEQPWRFKIGVKNEDSIYPLIFDSLVEFNKTWAQYAPLLIVCCCRKNNTHNEKPNYFASYDTGQAVAFLTLQAMAHNLFVHQMGGFDKSKIRENLKINESYDIITVIAIGYSDNIEKLPEDIRKTELTERQRKKIEEISL